MTTDFSELTVQRPILDAGEQEFAPAAKAGLQTLIAQAAAMLDAACLTNVLLVEASDGQIYLGEFLFALQPVTRQQAQELAQRHGETI
jgi:hypothetical protein